MESLLSNSEFIKMDDIMMIERPYDKRPIFKISWKMTDLCPYACSYCYMSNAVEKAKHCKDNPTQEFVESIASKFNTLYNRLADTSKDEVQLHLIGGEPSLFNLINVLKKVENIPLRYISLASNIYRPASYYQELKEYAKSRGIDFGCSASFHLEQCNPDEYAKKLIELKFQCKAVVNKNNISIYKPYFDEFMKHNLAIEITIERDNANKVSEMSDEDLEYITKIRKYQFDRKASHSSYLPYYTVTLKNGRKINYSSNIAMINSIIEHKLDCTGFYCDAGLHNVRIEKNGNLKRSACRICSMYFKMGNILKDDYEKPNGMIICKCNEAGKDGIYQDKFCTAFNNTSMYRLGYNKITGIYDKNHGIEIPDYYNMIYGKANE